MARDVVLRKLQFLRRVLRDLEGYRGATIEQVTAHHYAIERLLELLVTAASDLLFHLLSERSVEVNSYREAFERAGKHGLLPAALAARLREAAGLRNRLVHLYEEISMPQLRESAQEALDDFPTFIEAIEQQLG